MKNSENYNTPLQKEYNILRSLSLQGQVSGRKELVEGHRTLSAEDKWISMRNYRKAKGLCFICGEKWSKDHQCKSTVHLHVVQELIEQLESSTSSLDESDSDSDNLMLLSAAATSNSVSVLSLSLPVIIRDAELKFLVDSGSTHSFLDSSLHHILSGITDIKAAAVKVAGGGKLICSQQVKHCQFCCQGQEFFT